jgi:hypothetical protein
VPEPQYQIDKWHGEKDCIRFTGNEVETKTCCGGKRVRSRFYVNCSLLGKGLPAHVMCRRDICRSYLRSRT